MKYYVYILYSKSMDKYYYGSSDKPYERTAYHNNLEKGFTKRGRPWRIEFTQGFYTREEALKAEKQLKKWKSRRMTQLVIDGVIDLRDYI